MGCFITFEGPDGSGKTTQIQALYGHLLNEGYRPLCLREPGGTNIGDQIRTVLHDVNNTEMQARAEVLLYSASRAQLVGQIIRPALEAGRVVLCDRYAESTMAYQGFGHRLDRDLLKAITAFATGGLRPDLIVYLDLPVEHGLERRQVSFRHGEGEWNRMDQKELDFHHRARSGYLQMAAEEPKRWYVLDARQPIAALQASIRCRVKDLLSEKGIGRARQSHRSVEEEGGRHEAHREHSAQ
jgi:dTMP kinase